MKNDAKIEEELTCQFKADMGNLTNFDLSTQKSQKYQKSLNIDANFDGKLTSAFKNDMKNFAYFRSKPEK